MHSNKAIQKAVPQLSQYLLLMANHIYPSSEPGNARPTEFTMPKKSVRFLLPPSFSRYAYATEVVVTLSLLTHLRYRYRCHVDYTSVRKGFSSIHLCQQGVPRARDVLKTIFYHDGDIYSTEDHEHLFGTRIELPREYRSITPFLRAARYEGLGYPDLPQHLPRVQPFSESDLTNRIRSLAIGSGPTPNAHPNPLRGSATIQSPESAYIRVERHTRAYIRRKHTYPGRGRKAFGQWVSAGLIQR